MFVIWGLGFGLYMTQIPKEEAMKSLPSADAVTVLTGDSKRLERGLDLLAGEKGKRLLVSGVHPQVRAAELAALTGYQMTLFTCCVDLGREAANTTGNAREIKQWRQANKYQTLLVVTSDYHMPRTLLWLKKIDPEGSYIPVPAVSGAPLVYFVREYNKYLITLLQNGSRMESRTPNNDQDNDPKNKSDKTNHQKA